jgi:hypothetical protein
MAFNFISALSFIALLLAATEAAHLPQAVADTLNFALNLECLEAQFYSCAVFGKLVYAPIYLLLLKFLFCNW